MAAISNMQLKWPNPTDLSPVADVPLDALPTPAAVVNADGALLAANLLWRSAHTNASPGADGLEWCDPELRAGLLTAIQRAIAGQAGVVQDYGTPESPRRITVSPTAAGALLFDHEVIASTEPKRKEQAEKMETVGRLVGGVAHDFANLLTLIAGYSDILLNRIGEMDPLRPELDEIRKAANRGARLTSQLLGFTRGQAVQPTVLDLNAIVLDLQRMLGLVIGEHTVLQTQLAPNLHKVVADSGQMEQVIMNLILNARDAMPTGGEIRVETANTDVGERVAREHGIKSGRCVMLSISDTGHGIEPAALAHIFEPFFTTKESGKGTGLGLSTVHRIVKESGGDIWVHSEPGAGSTFTICLPSAPSGSQSGDVAAGPRPSAAGSETLLLVEDEEGVRKLLTHVLTKRGYNVIAACDGEEALEIFERRGSEIHLVLTDMVMPRMGGRTLGARLRDARPDVKIIYMSGYTDDVLVRTGALGPGMSFLQKPFRPEVLAAKVRETLDRR